MAHWWPVRQPRPIVEKLSGDTPVNNIIYLIYIIEKNYIKFIGKMEKLN